MSKFYKCQDCDCNFVSSDTNPEKSCKWCSVPEKRELINPFHTQLAIGILLQDEDALEEKLNLLTEISLATTKRETFEICEGFRERLCNQEKETVGRDSLPVIYKREAEMDSELSKRPENNGDE